MTKNVVKENAIIEWSSDLKGKIGIKFMGFKKIESRYRGINCHLIKLIGDNRVSKKEWPQLLGNLDFPHLSAHILLRSNQGLSVPLRKIISEPRAFEWYIN